MRKQAIDEYYLSEQDEPTVLVQLGHRVEPSAAGAMVSIGPSRQGRRVHRAVVHCPVRPIAAPRLRRAA